MSSTTIYVALLFGYAAAAQDWPRFRGPNGSGVAAAGNLPVVFGPENNVLWKIPVPPGHSSPVIVGRQVYLTAFANDSLLTSAYDRDTGRRLWARTVGRIRKGKHHDLNNPASPTPAADSNGVVAFFQDFGLIAYSADGKSVWQHPLEPPRNNHGSASSPVLVDDMVVQVLGGDPGSQLIALDRKEGIKRWEAPLSGVTYATPVVVPRGGKANSVVVASTGEVVGFDLNSGRRTWWVRRIPYQPKASPVVSPDGSRVFVAVLSVSEQTLRLIEDFDKLLSLWDVNGDSSITQAEVAERKGPVGGFPQIDINGDGVFDRPEHTELMSVARYPNVMGAIPANAEGDLTSDMIWVYRKSVPNVPSPLLYEGVFYAVKEGGIGVALDAATGAVIKEGRISPAFGAMFASPVAKDNKIYAISQAGKVAVLKAGKDWEPLALNDLGEECFATPALSGDRLLIRTVAHLWCFRDAGIALRSR